MTFLFPVEVLEHIFQFLDGKSFCKIQEVCKVWKDIIKELQTKKKIWKQFCLREIPLNVMEEIFFNKSLPSDEKLMNWTVLYKKWYRSKMIIKAPYTVKNILTSFQNQSFITCLKLSGSWIITGHSSGHLCVWNQYTGDLSQRILCHLKSIVDIALIDLLNLGSYQGLTDDDNLWEHHHIITISKDSYIHVISLVEEISAYKMDNLICHSTALTGIRVFNSKFVVSCSDNTVSVWNMELQKTPFYYLKATLLQKIIGPNDVLLSLGLWHDEIKCISYGRKLKVYDKYTDQWIDEKCLESYYQEEQSEPIHNKFVTLTKLYFFQNKIVIMFTSDGRMATVVDEKFNIEYNLMENLQTLITSVALKGTILALGGENGNIYVFYLPEIEDILKINLSSPTFSHRLSEASITSIDIAYDVETPIILASTNESLFVVRWFSDLSSHQIIRQRTLDIRANVLKMKN